jgi:hypothetical protein
MQPIAYRAPSALFGRNGGKEDGKKTSADAEDDKRWPLLDSGGEINFPARRSPQNTYMLC